MEFGLNDIRILDVIDVIVVLYLMYLVYKLLKGTVAINIFIGVVVFYFVYWLVNVLELQLLKILLGSFVSFGLIILVIIFQPELRRFLLMLGDTTVGNNIGLKFMEKLFSDKPNVSSASEEISETIAEVVTNLSKARTGALIIITKNDILEIVNSGTYIDGLLSAPMLQSLFYKNSALHDGAVIIKGKRIVAAGCILPLSQNTSLPKDLGLRHRAAVGVTESNTALAIVVSEETGELMVSENGKWKRSLHALEVKKIINTFLSN